MTALVVDLAPQRGRQLYATYWVALSLLVVGMDYASGPTIQFPVMFVLPVTLAAWYSGWPWSTALAIVLPLVRLSFTTIRATPWPFSDSVINAVIRIGVLGFLAVLVDRVAVQAAVLGRRVRVLEGMLPVCAVCKRIRDEADVWQPLEEYVMFQARDRVQHELCPTCADKFGEIIDRR